ncbi:MAG: ABC transporter permease [Deltaproteobacteria bacterium]|nr:ABC transporter permease [Deltaproteobacteria bacterium]
MILLRYVSLRHLRLKPIRVALAILGICCGTALYVALSMINSATSVFFHESVAAVSGNATLLVSAGPAGFPEKLGALVEKVEGVTSATPIIEARSWLLSSDESILVLGVDLLANPVARGNKSSAKPIVQDALSFMNHADSIIVTRSFADAHRLKLGERLRTSTANGVARLVVRGVLENTDLAQAYGGNVAIMDIDAARIAFGKTAKTDRLDVVTAKAADVDQVAARIRAAVGAGYTVQRPALLSEQMNRTVESFQFLTHLLTMLALIVGVLMISSCVAISVAERSREIGSLRAMGTTRGTIIQLFVFEALFMGSLGSVLGIALGRGMAGLMVKAVTTALAETSAHHIETAQLRLTGSMCLTAVAIGALTSLVAAIWPALKAARIPPVEAMKAMDSGSEKTTRRLETFQVWGGLGLLALFAVGASLVNTHTPVVFQALIQVFAIFGVALLGPVLVLVALRIFSAATPATAGMVPRLATENALKNPARTRSQATILLIGLTLVVVISCVSQSFKQTLLNYYSKTLHADLLISATGRFHDAETQLLSPALGAKIRAVTGVKDICEVREVSFEYDGGTVTIKSYGEPAASDSEAMFVLRDRDAHEASTELFHASDAVVLISENFAARTRKRSGDSIELRTPSGLRAFRIIGVVAEYTDPQGTLVISRASYLKFFHSDLVGGYAVQVRPGFAPADVRRALDHALSKQYKLQILSNAEIRSQVGTVIDSSFAYTKAAELMALLVAMLGLMDTIFISVFSRTRELGLMRAIGMNRSSIGRMILLEAAQQGLVAGIIAVGLGSFISVIWIRSILTHSLGWAIAFHFPWPVMVSTLALGVGVTVLAAWYPARRAANIEIVDALTCL